VDSAWEQKKLEARKLLALSVVQNPQHPVRPLLGNRHGTQDSPLTKRHHRKLNSFFTHNLIFDNRQSDYKQFIKLQSRPKYQLRHLLLWGLGSWLH